MGVPWLVNAFMLVLVSGSSLLSLAVACLVLGGAQVLVSTFVNPVLGGLTIVVLAALVAALPAGGLRPWLIARLAALPAALARRIARSATARARVAGARCGSAARRRSAPTCCRPSSSTT